MTTIPALDRLRLFLRPPGKGIHSVSTGGGFAAGLQRKLYGTDTPAQVQSAWEDSLQRVRRAEVFVLGIPSDTGAGIMRGANFGPIGVREAYLAKYGAYPKGVLDIGDILCVPQLLHDEMLSDRQVAMTRAALYGDLKDVDLPVSPLSMAEQALLALHELNPTARIAIIGGDHSVSWPAMLYCHRRCGQDFGVVHFDAHTDLLEHRLGVRFCYTTWAWHALKLMQPYGLVQVGVRTSGKPRDYWMSQYPVIQLWAADVAAVGEEKTIQRIVEHYKESGITKIYVSNDIDGTDLSYGAATGTPEANGLTPQFVLGLVRALRAELELIGGDVVEVAPPLSGSREFATEKTCLLGAEYLQAMID